MWPHYLFRGYQKMYSMACSTWEGPLECVCFWGDLKNPYVCYRIHHFNGGFIDTSCWHTHIYIYILYIFIFIHCHKSQAFRFPVCSSLILFNAERLESPPELLEASQGKTRKKNICYACQKYTHPWSITIFTRIGILVKRVGKIYFHQV